MAIGRPVTLTSNIAFKSVTATATAGQTSFTVTGGYNINKIAVFRNGVRLVDADDYEARDGASVTLLSPATLGDMLEFQIFDDFRVADALTADGGTVFGDVTIAGVTTLTGAGVNVTGVVTSTSFNIGSNQVISSARELQNIASLDSTTTTTIENAIANAPNTITDLNVSGISTFVGIATFGSGVGIADSIFHLEDDNTAIRFPANDTFTVETDGTERLRIDSSGDVGIGTQSPETPRGNRGLEVAGTTGAEIVATRTDDNITDGDFIGGFVFKNLDAGGSPNHFAGMYAKANGTAGSMDLHFTADRAQYEADTSDLVIRSSNVGIGTDTPDSKLHVFGDTTSFIKIETADGTTNPIVMHENPDRLWHTGLRGDTNDSYVIRDQTATSNRVVINTSGQVGIATDSADRTLHVNGTVISNVTDLGDVTGITTLNFTDSNNFVLTLTGTTTFADPTGIATGQSGVIVLKQDGTGSRTATFHNNFLFKSGTAPTLSVGAGKSDAIAYYCFEPPYIIAGTFIGIGTQ